MSPEFSIKSANPASILRFTNRSQYYFDVTVKTPSLRATKKVSIYDYGLTDGFVEFFQRLASYEKPWVGEETWEPLEGGMKLGAKCDALGHVEFRVVLRENENSIDVWSLDCSIFLDFGMLSHHAADAKKFAVQ